MDKQFGALDAEIAVHDVRAAVRDGIMSPFQKAGVGICMAINALDGFDVLAIAFAGPLVAKQWALSPTQLGLLFSSGLAGMTLGALLLSPLADIFGRRTLVLAGLILITLGMILSGTAGGLPELMAMRAVTGLGVGALISSINTIVTEYSSTKRKALSISFMTIGYPIGAAVGGIISVFLIHSFGWRAVFLFGGALSALLLPVALFRLPESLDFLFTRRPPNALNRANALLRRMKYAEIAALPPPHLDGPRASMFDQHLARRTFMICAAYFLTMLPFYFMLTWTPKVLVDEGLSIATGISGAVLMNGTGVLGGLMFGLLASRVGLRPMTAWVLAFFFAAIVGFGLSARNLPVELALAGAVGFFLTATIAGLYAVIGAMFPPGVRNTATGIAVGFGRFGAVAGPYIGGVLMSAGWTRPAYCLVLAAPLLAAAVLIRRVPLLPAVLVRAEAPPARQAA